MVPREPLGPASFFHSQFADAPLRHICKAIITGHETAWRYCQDNFSPTVRHDNLALLRRAHVETAVASILQRYDNVRVVPTLNSTGSAYHNVITCGKVSLTLSAVDASGEVPRDARFRQEYAGQCQYDLLETDIAPADATLFAVVIHGPPEFPADADARATMRFDRPAFIEVGFPHRTFRKWQTDTIDLLRRFPDLTHGGVANESGTPVVPLRPIVLPSEG